MSFCSSVFYKFNLQASDSEIKKGEAKFSSSHSERLGGEGVCPAGVTGRLHRVREQNTNSTYFLAYGEDEMNDTLKVL